MSCVNNKEYNNYALFIFLMKRFYKSKNKLFENQQILLKRVCYHMLEIQFNGIELRKHFNSLQTFIGYQIYFTKKSKLFKARNLLNQTFVHKISFSMWMVYIIRSRDTLSICFRFFNFRYNSQ